MRLTAPHGRVLHTEPLKRSLPTKDDLAREVVVLREKTATQEKELSALRQEKYQWQKDRSDLEGSVDRAWRNFALVARKAEIVVVNLAEGEEVKLVHVKRRRVAKSNGRPR